MKPAFYDSVMAVCKKIPKGKVCTYKMVASAIKNPKAYRAVGNALSKNKALLEIPCHRVVRSNGEVGGYANTKKAKIKLLVEEGIDIGDKKIDLKKYLYKLNS